MKTGSDFDQGEYAIYIAKRRELVRKAELMRFFWQSLKYNYVKGLARAPAEIQYLQDGCPRIDKMHSSLEAENQRKVAEFLTGLFEGHDVKQLAAGVRTAFDDCISK